MQNIGVIDRFLDIFARYIDSGFGLIAGDIGFLASSLIVIDVTLALLFWTWGESDDILARLVKKTLQVGFFAFLISNWNALAKIIYLSFSGLGLRAAGGGNPDDLLHPGRIASIGLDAGRPLLDQASELAGPVGLFTNFAEIAVLLLAWAIVLLAFFIIAIQLFVTLIEFKLVTLAGFILVPFGLFGRTAFLAERVLGNVMATGIKVLVLAIIIGIGSTIFDEFTANYGSDPATLEQVGAIALATLTLLGLSIFGPGIASGLVSGGPQLGAGAAVGTAFVATGVGAVVGAGVAGAASLAGSTAKRASAPPPPSRSSAAPTHGGGSPSSPSAPPAPAGGAPTPPLASAAPGSGGGGAGRPSAPPAPASSSAGQGGGMIDTPADAPEGPNDGAPPVAPLTTDSGASAASSPSAADTSPAWAKRLRRQQLAMQGLRVAATSLRSADHGGGSAHINLED
ncbi:MAG: P-type conjugative transfer protein TrbL, partial [Sphingopyxis sp.]